MFVECKRFDQLCGKKIRY